MKPLDYVSIKEYEEISENTGLENLTILRYPAEISSSDVKLKFDVSNPPVKPLQPKSTNDKI